MPSIEVFRPSIAMATSRSVLKFSIAIESTMAMFQLIHKGQSQPIDDLWLYPRFHLGQHADCRPPPVELDVIPH
jgi:hypothetical protein